MKPTAEFWELWGLPLLVLSFLAVSDVWLWLRILATFGLVTLGEFRILLNKDVWRDHARQLSEGER